MSTDRKPPPLSREELQQLKALLAVLLTWVSAWTVFYLDVDALWLIGLVSLAGWTVLVAPTLPGRIPPWGHRLAFPVILGAFLFDLYATRQALPALVRLDLCLLLYRLISYRRRRDDLQLILLGLFLVVAAGVLTASLLFVGQILLFTACALGLLLLITLTDGSLGNLPAKVGQEASAGSAATPEWARRVQWTKLPARVVGVTDWRVVVLAGGLFLGVVGVSALLFMAIPRYELGGAVFLERFIQKKSRTGFSEQVRFGDVTSIQSDEGLALTVDPSDPSLLPAVPYWRMVVLDQYREATFRMSPELLSELHRGQAVQHQMITGTVPARRAGAAEWKFYLEPGVSRFLPLGGAYWEVLFARPMEFHVNHGLHVVALKNEPVELLGFWVRGLQPGPVLTDTAFARRLRVEERGGVLPGPDYRRITLPPESVAQLKAYVNEITGGRSLPPEEFARAASAWLEFRHRYSMESAIEEGPGDPLVRWIGSKGPGHCEFFAGAFTLLARTAGHPTRVITGFKGGRWNEISRSLSVRNSDAHAWCEIWNGRDGWLRVDPTPGGVAVPDTTGAVEARGVASREQESGWTARVNALRVFWYRKVVNFDQASQEQMAGNARRWFESTGKNLRIAVERALHGAVRWLRQPWDVWRVGWCVGFVGLWTALFLIVRRWFRRGAWLLEQRWTDRLRRDPVRREAGRWLRRLADAASALPTASPRDPAWASVRAELEELRFGRRKHHPEADQIFIRARRLVKSARASARQS